MGIVEVSLLYLSLDFNTSALFHIKLSRAPRCRLQSGHQFIYLYSQAVTPPPRTNNIPARKYLKAFYSRPVLFRCDIKTPLRYQSLAGTIWI